MTARKILPALCLVLIGVNAIAQPEARPALVFQWPAHWEYRELRRDSDVLQIQARCRLGDVVDQTLTLSAVATRSADKPVDAASILALARQLRDVTLRASVEKQIEIVPFSSATGYYFVATNRRNQPGEYRQLIEGVLLQSGYLINFTLRTDDAAADPALETVRMLDKLQVSVP